MKVLVVFFYGLICLQHFCHGVKFATMEIALRIDHSSWFYRDLYNMRYYASNHFFNASGPMIVQIGDQPLEKYEPGINGGLLWYLAENLGGYMFIAEHRYYGESVPNLDLGTRNLAQLTIEQAMADLVDFINDRKRNLPELKNSKVVVIGGGYAGNLATWLRLKESNIVHAAVASSAPIQATMDFYKYDEMVQRIIQEVTGSGSCVKAITSVISTVRSLLQTNEGVTNITKTFGLCDPLNADDPKEVEHFFYNYASIIGNYIQSNPSTKTKEMCDSFTAGSPYAQIGNFIASNSDGCLKSYLGAVGDLQNTGMNPSTSTNRVWFYQMCTQLGYFATTNSNDQPFLDTVPLSYFSKKCFDTFGILFNRFRTSLGVFMTNKRYGGLSPKVTKVFSAQGSLDPWTSIGLSQDISPIAPAVVIPGAWRYAIMLPKTADANTYISQARTRILFEVSSWIQ